MKISPPKPSMSYIEPDHAQNFFPESIPTSDFSGN